LIIWASKDGKYGFAELDKHDTSITVAISNNPKLSHLEFDLTPPNGRKPIEINQSNAKEFTRGTIDSTDREAQHKCFMFLTDLTTAYYADEVIKWIETKVKFEKLLSWIFLSCATDWNGLLSG
jgi:hypothetical protein